MGLAFDRVERQEADATPVAQEIEERHAGGLGIHDPHVPQADEHLVSTHAPPEVALVPAPETIEGAFERDHHRLGLAAFRKVGHADVPHDARDRRVHVGRKRAVGPADDHALPDVLAPPHDAPGLRTSVLLQENHRAVGEERVLGRIARLPFEARLDPDAALPECP